MWLETFEFLRNVIAVLCCSTAVKLVDDYLDREIDCCAGRKNWFEYFGQNSFVYAMLFLVMAAGFNAHISMPLFLASYIVGMFNDFKSLFPSRLNGWQESVLVMAVGILCFSWNVMCFAVFFILGLQCFDDCLDIQTDYLAGQRNFAQRFGLMECFMIGIMSFLIAAWLNEAVFWPVLCGAIIFYAMLLKCQEAKK